MSLIEDPYADTRGWIIFPILSADCFDAIATFYKTTGSIPYKVESRGDDTVAHLVHLRHLPSLMPMGTTTAPEYTVEYQTDSFVWGISRMVIRDNERRCVVRYERDSSGWSTFSFDKPRLRYYTD